MANNVVHWEIGGHDLDGLSTFYRGLFGWEATGFDADYRLVALTEGIGGGLMRCRDDVPSYVTIYVTVDDLDAALARVGELGGTPLMSPTEIPGVGSYALFQDPEGNMVGLLHGVSPG